MRKKTRVGGGGGGGGLSGWCVVACGRVTPARTAFRQMRR